jgi:phosphoserine phosphatase
VLTERAVNMQYARLLDSNRKTPRKKKASVEKKLAAFEEKFARGGTTDQFNREFVPLFREAEFSKKRAEEFFEEVAFRPGYDDLLERRDIDLYLVTSGPSYFVDLLARQENFVAIRDYMCSRYKFDDEDRLEVWSPADLATKAAFVMARAKGYEVTVGIGNNVEQDSAFLSHCMIQIMVMKKMNPGYLCVSQLSPVLRLLDSLAAALGSEG